MSSILSIVQRVYYVLNSLWNHFIMPPNPISMRECVQKVNSTAKFHKTRYRNVLVHHTHANAVTATGTQPHTAADRFVSNRPSVSLLQSVRPIALIMVTLHFFREAQLWPLVRADYYPAGLSQRRPNRFTLKDYEYLQLDQTENPSLSFKHNGSLF